MARTSPTKRKTSAAMRASSAPGCSSKRLRPSPHTSVPATPPSVPISLANIAPPINANVALRRDQQQGLTWSRDGASEAEKTLIDHIESVGVLYTSTIASLTDELSSLRNDLYILATESLQGTPPQHKNQALDRLFSLQNGEYLRQCLQSSPHMASALPAAPPQSVWNQPSLEQSTPQSVHPRGLNTNGAPFAAPNFALRPNVASGMTNQMQGASYDYSAHPHRLPSTVRSGYNASTAFLTPPNSLQLPSNTNDITDEMQQASYMMPRLSAQTMNRPLKTRQNVSMRNNASSYPLPSMLKGTGNDVKMNTGGDISADSDLHKKRS